MLLEYATPLTFVALGAIFAYSFYAVLIAGQLSLGQAGFASLAAFTGAALAPERAEIGDVTPLLVAIVIGMAVGALAAVVLGLPTMHLRGVFLAIATLGFAEAVRVVLLNSEWTGGAQGLAVPRVLTLGMAWTALAVVAYWFWRMGRPGTAGRWRPSARTSSPRGPWASTSGGTGSRRSSPPAPSPACTACCSPTTCG